MMSDATTFEHLFSHSVPKVYAGFISIFFMTICMFIFDYRLAIALFWVVPVAYIIFKILKHKNEKKFKKGFDLNREIIDDFQEGLDLVSEIKSYNMEKYFVENINKKYDKDKAHKMKSEVLLESVLNLSFVLIKLSMATVAIYGAYLFIGAQIDLFTYLVFIINSVLTFNPINAAMMNYTMMTLLDSIVERIREINNMPAQDGKLEFKPNGYDIEFNNVNFSYEDGIDVLKNLSFVAKQGEVTALVGHSGSGKTTAAKLAARFWDIQSGKITIGGIDISDIDPETLLKEFSIVFQDVSLF